MDAVGLLAAAGQCAQGAQQKSGFHVRFPSLLVLLAAGARRSAGPLIKYSATNENPLPATGQKKPPFGGFFGFFRLSNSPHRPGWVWS